MSTSLSLWSSGYPSLASLGCHLPEGVLPLAPPGVNNPGNYRLVREGNLSKPIKTFIIIDADDMLTIISDETTFTGKTTNLKSRYSHHLEKDVSLPIIPFAILLFSFIPLGASLASLRGLWIPYPTKGLRKLIRLGVRYCVGTYWWPREARS